MTRDPVEEDGGLGLYRFYRNLPVNGFDALGMEWKIMRNGSDFADACAPTTADTFSSLAKLLRLDRKDLDKWAHTSDAEAVPGRLYKIPNLVVFHFGAEKSDDKAYLSLFSTLRRKRKDEMSAALGSGYKVLSSNNVNSHQILTAMSSDGLYKYTFVGHGYSSFINTYPDVEGLFVGPGRYTKYGITLLQLFSWNSADDDIRRRHTVGRARDTIRVWSSNVARAGLFIGYSGSPVLMSEMFSWTPIRGTNEE